MDVSGLAGVPYETLSLLGTGGYAEVFKVKHTPTGELFALKRIKKYRLNDSNTRQQIQRQVELMRHMNHPNIIKLIETFETEEELNLVLELAEGNLYDKLSQYGSFPQNRVVSYIKDLVEALEYLHLREKQIIHRDIKPQNLLVDAHGNLKLSDFGSANIISKGGMRMTYAGTKIYMAPEMVTNSPYTTSLDLWNVGLIIYELLTGQNPFQQARDESKLENMILNSQLTFPNYFPVLARDTVKRLLKKNPEERMTLEQLKSHIWLNIGMESTSLLKSRFDMRKSKKYEDTKTAIHRLKEELKVKKEEEEEIGLIKEKIAERRKQCQLMALAEPDNNYVGMRDQLLQLNIQMRENENKLKQRHEKIKNYKQKHALLDKERIRQILDYEMKMEKLKELPTKKHIQLKNQLTLAINCIQGLTKKMEALPQTLKTDLEHTRMPIQPLSRESINLDLAKITLKTLTSEYNALREKKEYLMLQHGNTSCLSPEGTDEWDQILSYSQRHL